MSVAPPSYLAQFRVDKALFVRGWALLGLAVAAVVALAGFIGYEVLLGAGRMAVVLPLALILAAAAMAAGAVLARMWFVAARRSGEQAVGRLLQLRLPADS